MGAFGNFGPGIDEPLVGIATKGGRGIMAPQMNLLDGANVVCAVLAARRVKESSEAVKGLAGLKGVRQAFRFPENNAWRFDFCPARQMVDAARRKLPVHYQGWHEDCKRSGTFKFAGIEIRL